jgi:hypothetical protein
MQKFLILSVLSTTVMTIFKHMFKKQCSQDGTVGTMMKPWAIMGWLTKKSLLHSW